LAPAEAEPDIDDITDRLTRGIRLVVSGPDA
jgi:hypothetical protein